MTKDFYGPFIHIHFTTPFEPILVTGDNGKKYKIIPSDQFK